MWSYNKGEWSEPYVFLKLLEEGVLYAADSDLNKISDIHYPIIKILREECGQSMEYLTGDEVVIKSGLEGQPILRLSLDEFKQRSLMLLEKIQQSPGKAGSFVIPETESFLKEIKIEKVKSDSKNKRDITIVVHDSITGLKPTLGFSIKSQLGSPATLLNPSGSTNFIYQVSGVRLSLEQIQGINTMKRVKNRIDAIKSMGGHLDYIDTQRDVLALNMQIVDSKLPEIFGHLLLKYYSTAGIAALEPLVKLITDENPCNYCTEHGHPFYRYKVKKFLVEVALGMVPTGVWKGAYDATGGYIVVRSDGEVLCYHIYNRNEFEEYLVKNTRFDSPTQSRYKYGKLYEENGEVYLKLCLQIRFK